MPVSTLPALPGQVQISQFLQAAAFETPACPPNASWHTQLLTDCITPHTQAPSPASRDTACTSTANKQNIMSPSHHLKLKVRSLFNNRVFGRIYKLWLSQYTNDSINQRQQRREAIYLLGEGNADIRHRQAGWDCQELRFLPEPSYLARGMELAVKEKLHSAFQAGLTCVLGQT